VPRQPFLVPQKQPECPEGGSAEVPAPRCSPEHAVEFCVRRSVAAGVIYAC